MSKLKSLGSLVLICSLFLPGCEKEADGGRAGLVKATPAYLEHFGEAPTPEEGTCFARVGFLPSAGEPAMILPVPLFLFAEEDQLRLLLERLLAMEMFYPRAETFYRSFPEGASLISASREGDRVLVDLDLPGTAEISALAACITETAFQFSGVERVLISRKGAAPAGDAAGRLRLRPFADRTGGESAASDDLRQLGGGSGRDPDRLRQAGLLREHPSRRGGRAGDPGRLLTLSLRDGGGVEAGEARGSARR